MTVFIKTHGRPNSQHTLKALREAGYTGTIVLVLDDEDDTIKEYDRYVNARTAIVVFNKESYVQKIDSGVSNPKREVNLYAWCACEYFAKGLGLTSCVMADDDITGFRYRYAENGSLKSLHITQGMNKILKSYLDFIEDNHVCATAFGTNQMYMGGIDTLRPEKTIDFRAPYNFIFRNMEYDFSWVSGMYEDTISPVLENQRGKYTIQLPFVQLEMKDVAAGAEGGMTVTYNQTNTFKRIGSLFQYHPSCVRYVTTSKKITHGLYKDRAFPKLVSSSFQLK